MTYLLTFLEGVITFVSPCLLPLLPVYLAFFAGDVAPDETPNVRRTLVGSLCFVLGFATLFTLMGAFAGAVGTFLVQYRRVLDIVFGVALVVLGLNYMGVFHLSLFDRMQRANARPSHGPMGMFVFGLAFALCWTPCVGAFLASALSLAATSASAVSGVGLLACFSAGLGLPFVLSSVLIDQLKGAFAWVKKHYTLVNRVCGGLLVAEGVLMATGLLGSWMSLLA